MLTSDDARSLSREELAGAIERAAADVRNAPHATAPLRNVKEVIEEWVVRHPNDEATAELFAGCLLVEHVLVVLVGDVVYQQASGRLADDILLSLCGCLEALARRTRSPGIAPATFYESYRAAVSTYLVKVRRLSELVAEGQ